MKSWKIWLCPYCCRIRTDCKYGLIVFNYTKTDTKISSTYRPMFCMEINDCTHAKLKLYPVTLSIKCTVVRTMLPTLCLGTSVPRQNRKTNDHVTCTNILTFHHQLAPYHSVCSNCSSQWKITFYSSHLFSKFITTNLCLWKIYYHMCVNWTSII